MIIVKNLFYIYEWRKRSIYMPIFEFRCQDCQHIFELLVMNEDNTVEMKCPSCDSETFERVMSTTSFSVGGGATGKGKVSSQSRTCAGGSCTTYEIPGPTR